MWARANFTAAAVASDPEFAELDPLRAGFRLDQLLGQQHGRGRQLVELGPEILLGANRLQDVRMRVAEYQRGAAQVVVDVLPAVAVPDVTPLSPDQHRAHLGREGRQVVQDAARQVPLGLRQKRAGVPLPSVHRAPPSRTPAVVSRLSTGSPGCVPP